MLRRLARVLVVVSLGALASSASADGQPLSGDRFYEVRGVRLYTQVRGAGPPIVFLHGGVHFFDNTFARQAAYFATFRTVIGIDQRGHGHSPDNEQPFSYREMAEDTAALLQQLGVAHADIVGHSDGANVGLLLARYHSELVRRLVVSGANLRGDLDGEQAYERARTMPAAQAAAGLPPHFRDDYIRVSPDGEDHWLTVVAKSVALWSTRVVLDRVELGAIQMPVLVVAGDHDFAPLEHTIDIFRGLPKGQLWILPKTGHATMLEHPGDFNSLTRAFFEQADAR